MKARVLTVTALVLALVASDGAAFTALHSFSAVAPISGTNEDGAKPRDGLTVSGGVVYGTTQNGGNNGKGTD